MYFVSGCDNDITQSRSSLWGLKKMKMIKQVLKKILKVQQENGEKKNEKKCAAAWNRSRHARSPGEHVSH